jgi:phosphoribosylanthranilate isomerase
VVRVKICCIQDVEEAALALRCGAAALGFVTEMPSGPGVIPESRIARIAATLPPAVGSFLLTSRTHASAIEAQQRRCAINTLQTCDRPEPGAHRILRQRLPGIALVQVVHVTGEACIEEALTFAPEVDALLLDSGNPTAAVKELGGTGRVHNWAWSRRIRDCVSVPVFLAGGLDASNVGDAIHTVQPFAVDVCSGVRSNGALDKHRLEAFFDSVRRASSEA